MSQWTKAPLRGAQLTNKWQRLWVTLRLWVDVCWYTCSGAQLKLSNFTSGKLSKTELTATVLPVLQPHLTNGIAPSQVNTPPGSRVIVVICVCTFLGCCKCPHSPVAINSKVGRLRSIDRTLLCWAAECQVVVVQEGICKYKCLRHLKLQYIGCLT